MKEKKLHLCLLCPGYPPEQHSGGIGTYAFEAVSALSKFPIKITVISRSDKFVDSQKKLSKNANLYRIGELKKAENNKKFLFRNDGYCEYGKRLLKTITDIDKNNKIDIIEACDWGAEAYFLLKKFNNKLIIRCQTPSFISEKFNPSNPKYLSKGLKTLEKKLLSSAPVLISANISLIDEIKSKISIKGVVRIEESPINLDNIPCKKNYSFKSTSCKILVVGRIEERKGQDILFKALEKINGNVSLHVIGADTPGRFGKSTKELFLEQINPETRKKIIFLNELPRERVLSMYRDYDIFVAPSRFDLGPFTLVEAMEAGVPSIGYNRHGIKEKIEHGKSGLLFNGTSDDLAKKILLLIKNEALRKKIGVSGRARAKKLYSSPVAGTSMFTTYQWFVEERLLQLSRQKSLEIIYKNKNFIHSGNHLLNVEENCLKIGSSLNLNQHEILALRLAAHWHDTGRIDYFDDSDHEKKSIILFQKWAANEGLHSSLVELVIKIINQHRNRGGHAIPTDKLSKIFWDADKLDIFNLERVSSIMKNYSESQDPVGEFNYIDSFNFWKSFDGSFEERLHTECAKIAFRVVYPKFQKTIGRLYVKHAFSAKKLVCVGGAEPMDNRLAEMNRQILTMVPKKRKTVCYVPIALFNQPELFAGMDGYIDGVAGFYRDLDPGAILTRISPKDSSLQVERKIEAADIIYLSGGNTKFLVESLDKSGVGKAIKKAYLSGKPIIGNSAGALALLEHACSIAESLDVHCYKGLGLDKKHVFLVHYTEKLSQVARQLSARFPGRVVLGLREEQAALLLNNRLVKIFN